MKYFLTAIALVALLDGLAQKKDTRAELDVEGTVNEISVSPDGSIWLTTAMGTPYCTKHVDSSWHCGDPVFRKQGASSYNAPHLNKISFFNRKQAIMTGYINGDPAGKNSRKNGLFITRNAGRDWDLIDFEGDQWVYDAFVDTVGHAWIGGSSGEIFYSYDFGERWEKLNSPFDGGSRIHSIWMLNEREGVAGALSNAIYTTENNWESSRKIITPFDQKLFEGRSDNRIEKIQVWGPYLVVSQNGHVFYSDRNKIHWEKFPLALMDFELDADAGHLYAIGKDLSVILLKTPAEFTTLDGKLDLYPSDLQVVNHTLYLVGIRHYEYEVHSISQAGHKKAMLYTHDRPIENPRLVKRSQGGVYWGVNRRHLYLSENGRDWYREKVLDFIVSDLKVENDSSAILWDGYGTLLLDGNGNNYRYTLKEHSAKFYVPLKPLENMPGSNITKVNISSGTRGCFHHDETTVQYESSPDGNVLSCDEFKKQEGVKDKTPRFRNKMNKAALAALLDSINLNPSYVPGIRSFHITEADKKRYLLMLQKRPVETWRGEKPLDMDFYTKIPDALDTISPATIKRVLDRSEGIHSTTSAWFSMEIINDKGDTLEIFQHFYSNSTPWHLPWALTYKGQHLSCYHPGLSSLISNSIPEGFMETEAFDNAYLIMKIADYLYSQRPVEK